MLSLAILSFVFGVQQQSKVDCELRAVRLENAAPALAKALSFESLAIDPRLKNDVLLLRVTDVEPEVLKSNLAKVLNATWFKDSNGWFLGQSEPQRIAEQNEYKKARFDHFSKLVENSKKYLSQAKPFDVNECDRIRKAMKAISRSSEDGDFTTGSYYANKKLEQSGPLFRFAYRLISRIRVEDWMKLTDRNPHAVFCSNPTSMQYPISFRYDDLVRSVIEEQNLWMSTAEKYGDSPYQGEDYEGRAAISFRSRGNTNNNMRANDLSVLTFALDANAGSIEVKAYNERGRRTISVSVSSDDFEPYDEATYQKDLKDYYSRKELKLSEDARTYVDLMSSGSYERNPSKSKALAPSLLEKILHPETTDPLSIAAAEVFLTATTQPNYIMVLNEELLSSERPSIYPTSFETADGEVLANTGGWFLLRQIDPVAKRKATPERRMLGEKLRFISAIKRPTTIEEDANFAFSLPWEQEIYQAFREHLLIVQPEEVDTYIEQSTLRIYGSFEASQISKAKKGGIEFSKLSAATKLEFYRSLFNGDGDQSQVEIQSLEEEPNEELQLKIQELESQAYEGILEEKTFLLPNGLSDRFLVTIEESAKDQLYGTTDYQSRGGKPYSYGQTYEASELGDLAFRATKPERYYSGDSEGRPNLDAIYVTTNRTIIIKLQISDFLLLRWNISKTVISDPRTFSTKNLPKQYQEAFQAAYAEAKKSDQEYGEEIDRARAAVRKRRTPPPVLL